MYEAAPTATMNYREDCKLAVNDVLLVPPLVIQRVIIFIITSLFTVLSASVLTDSNIKGQC